MDVPEVITKIVEGVLVMDNRPELHEAAGKLAQFLCDLASAVPDLRKLIRSAVTEALDEKDIDVRELNSKEAYYSFCKIVRGSPYLVSPGERRLPALLARAVR